MWIVRLALRRPYTIAVFALLIMMGGILCLKGMLIDIFPTIDIPVVGVVWNYPGLSAEDMEKRVTLYSERGITTTVNGVTLFTNTLGTATEKSDGSATDAGIFFTDRLWLPTNERAISGVSSSVLLMMTWMTFGSRV